MAGTGLILEKLASAQSSWHLIVTSAGLKLGIYATWKVSWGSEKCFLCIHSLPKNIFLYPTVFPNTFPDSLIIFNHYFQMKYLSLHRTRSSLQIHPLRLQKSLDVSQNVLVLLQSKFQTLPYTTLHSKLYLTNNNKKGLKMSSRK